MIKILIFAISILNSIIAYFLLLFILPNTNKSAKWNQKCYDTIYYTPPLIDVIISILICIFIAKDTMYYLTETDINVKIIVLALIIYYIFVNLMEIFVIGKKRRLAFSELKKFDLFIGFASLITKGFLFILVYLVSF